MSTMSSSSFSSLEDLDDSLSVTPETTTQKLSTLVPEPAQSSNSKKWTQNSSSGHGTTTVHGQREMPTPMMVRTAHKRYGLGNVSLTSEGTNGFNERGQGDGDPDESQQTDKVFYEELDSDVEDSRSEVYSFTSYEQNLSDLDDLLNEGLPEGFRGQRPLKKSRAEIVSLIHRGQESREDVESLEDGQIDDNEDMELVDDVEVIEEKSSQNTSPSKPKQDMCNFKEIIALEEKGKNPLETLPNGWIEVRHSSGMPLYLHRATRVCTWAKPYELRTGSARKHCIPISAIPCFSYRRALDREKEQISAGYGLREDSSRKRKHCDIPFDTSDTIRENESSNSESEIDSTIREILNYMLDTVSSNGADSGLSIPDDSTAAEGSKSDNLTSSSTETCLKQTLKFNGSILNLSDKDFPSTKTSPRIKGSPETLKNLLPCARVETARENNTVNSVQPLDFRTYCEKLFKFKHLKCMRFKTWSARRRHNKEQKRLHLQRPTLPDGVKLITFSVQNQGDTDGAKGNKEYIMNPQGKSSVCILHEYVQHALRMQPTYVFEELENAATPYLATVQINGVSYAVGYGSSKKQAKAAAAKATLELMIPEMKEELNGSKDAQRLESNHNVFFDQVQLDDPRITKMCANVSEPSPYALLLTCVQRNFGVSASSNIKFNMVSSGNQSNRFRMETGDYHVEVTAPNKREGKQLASQAMLAKIHPQIKNFGSFLVLYGNRSIKSVKEKKQEEQQITTLQSKASANSPNYAILSKLRDEMLKLKAELEEEELMKAFMSGINSNASSS